MKIQPILHETYLVIVTTKRVYCCRKSEVYHVSLTLVNFLEQDYQQIKYNKTPAKHR